MLLGLLVNGVGTLVGKEVTVYLLVQVPKASGLAPAPQGHAHACLKREVCTKCGCIFSSICQRSQQIIQREMMLAYVFITNENTTIWCNVDEQKCHCQMNVCCTSGL